MPASEREILFQNTAARAGMNVAVIEKDFWVCITLDHLFRHSKWNKQFAFKGGTSLSKAYHLIDRFSEDIDLILDWRVLGYSVNEPWVERSNNKQQKFIGDSRDRLFSFLKDDFAPEFRDSMSEIIENEASVFIKEDDDGTVCFEYPGSFNDESILRAIRLEIGALAAWTPTQIAEIKPYAADYYPDVFSQNWPAIRTTTAERSFWEKATILHQEAFRPDGSLIPERYSRHYYDLYCMAKTEVKERAINKPDLLEEVALFKQKFYPRKWARYDLARTGTLKLVPAEHSIDRLKADYAKMRPMIYGEYPSFEKIISRITVLEAEINK